MSHDPNKDTLGQAIEDHALGASGVHRPGSWAGQVGMQEYNRRQRAKESTWTGSGGASNGDRPGTFYNILAVVSALVGSAYIVAHYPVQSDEQRLGLWVLLFTGIAWLLTRKIVRQTVKVIAALTIFYFLLQWSGGQDSSPPRLTADTVHETVSRAPDIQVEPDEPAVADPPMNSPLLLD